MHLKADGQRWGRHVVGVASLHANVETFKGRDSMKFTVYGSAELNTNVPSMEKRACQK